MDLGFTGYYAPIFIFIVVAILVWAGLKKIKLIPVEWANVVIAIVLAIMITSSNSSVSYLFKLIPYLTIIFTVIFVLLLILVFATKDISTFQKPLAWIGFILAIIIVFGIAFNSFPGMYHSLPGTSDSHLSTEGQEIKHYVYSQTFKDNFIFVLSIVVVGFFLLKSA
jgi:hypothetical protein